MDKSLMKIVCVLGSPNPEGNSAALARRFCRAAEKRGAKARIFLLNELDYRGCQGCLACKTRLDRCALEDDLTAVLDAIRETNVLVLATPVYYCEVPGQVKAFIDRTFSFITMKYKTRPPLSRLTPGKTLVFIQTQGQVDESKYAGVYLRYRRIFSGYGFDTHYLIRACGVNFPGEIEKRGDLLKLAEETAEWVVPGDIINRPGRL